MSETKSYKYPFKIGPGGIRCQCCSPRENVKASRIAINRAYRRKTKLADTKEPYESQTDTAKA